MPHPLVLQLRFTRSEFMRALAGVTDEEAERRFLPMNCISWTVGHLAWQEQRYWLTYSQAQTPQPQLNTLVGYGQPACTPPLKEMLTTWQAVIQAADPFLDQITTAQFEGAIALGQWKTTVGSLMLRVIYHYWYHTGEIMAIRQMLGHSGLPEFVGNIDEEAPYRAEEISG